MPEDPGRSFTGRQIGTYQILSLLGAGGMGEIYRARDTKLGRDVAIKILPRIFTTDPERLARFEREARLLAAGDTVSDTIAAILEREPEWDALPAATSAAVRRLLQRCLEKDPKRRLRDIGDARIDLDDGLTGGLDQHATISATSTRRGRRRERLAWAMAGVVGLALAALAVPTVVSIRRTPAPEPLPTRFEITTPPTVDPASFALSSDGRQLAFVATAAGVARLMVRPFDQATAHPLVDTEGARFPFWAPDGRALGLFAGGKLKRVDLVGGAPQVLTDASGWGATWSRNGVIVFSGIAGGTAFPRGGHWWNPSADRAADHRRPQLGRYVEEVAAIGLIT